MTDTKTKIQELLFTNCCGVQMDRDHHLEVGERCARCLEHCSLETEAEAEYNDFRIHATEKRLNRALAYIELMKRNQRYIDGLKRDEAIDITPLFTMADYYRANIARRMELQLFMFNRLKKLL